MPSPRMLALADLHLSRSGDKPMDVFGEHWRDHDRRMAAAWDATVGSDDVVLLPGDLSWARSLADAAADLAWIAERPGTKLLLRGNHDSWWGGIERVRRALGPGMLALHLDSHRFGDVVVVGARGWTLPGDPTAVPADVPVFRRELERLRHSIADADRRFGRTAPRLAMVHYPPCLRGNPDSEVVDLLRHGGVRACVFGHLHGVDQARAPSGVRDGIAFRLVAADAVDFAPVEVGSLLAATG